MTIMSVIGILFVVGVAAKEPKANLLGLILCLMMGYYSYEAGYIANAIVNIAVLAPMQLLAYHVWKGTLHIDNALYRRIEKHKISLLGISLLFYSSVVGITSYFNNTTISILDIITASLVISATLLLMIKSPNQWYFWIPYNFLEVLLWVIATSVSQEMMAIAVMRVIFFINSIFGYINWNNKLTT